MKKPNDKLKKIYYSIAAGVILLLLILGSVILWGFFKDFAKNPQNLDEYLSSFGFSTYLVFLVLQILQIVFPIIPGEALEIGAGYIFGAFKGLLLCQLGIGIASVTIFFIVRRFGRPFLALFLNEAQFSKLKFLQSSKRLTLLVAILFFIPGTPKDLLTYFVGLTKIRPLYFILITIFARIPSIITSTLIGASFGEQNYTLTIIMGIVTAVLSICGVLYYAVLTKREKEELENQESSAKETN